MNFRIALFFLLSTVLAIIWCQACRCGRPKTVEDEESDMSVSSGAAQQNNPYGYGPTSDIYPWRGKKFIGDGMVIRGGQKHFQTRDMISITVTADVFLDASTFSLYNATPEETGELPMIILQDDKQFYKIGSEQASNFESSIKHRKSRK